MPCVLFKRVLPSQYLLSPLGVPPSLRLNNLDVVYSFEQTVFGPFLESTRRFSDRRPITAVSLIVGYISLISGAYFGDTFRF